MATTPDVYVIQKQTTIERYSRRDVNLDFFDYLERDGQKLTSLSQAHNDHVQTRAQLLKALDNRGVCYQVLNLDELAQGGFGYYCPNNPSSGLHPRDGIVLSLGGDGTLLHASHYCGGNVRLMGINSSPQRSVGHLCAANPSNIDTTLDNMLSNALHFTPVPRLKVDTSKGHPLPLALNDLLLSHLHPAATSRYQVSLSQGGRTLSEKHQSSGVWVATPAGSTAAIRTYGLPRLELHSRKYLYAVREIYIPPEASVSLVGGLLDGDTDSMIFFCRMRQGLVCVDGPDSFAPLGFGESLTVTLPAEATLQLLLS